MKAPASPSSARDRAEMLREKIDETNDPIKILVSLREREKAMSEDISELKSRLESIQK